MPRLDGGATAVRELEARDLDQVCALFAEIGWESATSPPSEHWAARAAWLDWTIAGYGQFAALNQPPLGERAIIDGAGRFVGLVGVVPRLEPFGRLPGLDLPPGAGKSPEIGLFWAVRPQAQGRGHASTAARLVADWLFTELGLSRLVAGTEHANTGSIAVMRKIGMRIEANPDSEPPWFQVNGVLEAPSGPAI